MKNVTLFKLFLVFFKLGLTSFGGPIAHLHYFRKKFVLEEQWLSEIDYQHLVALTQLLPGPSSSQIGMGIGFIKKGYLGSIIAWLGFTTPSVILMIGLGTLNFHFLNFVQTTQSLQAIQAIQAIVFTVISFSFWQMFRSFCKYWWQYIIMIFSCLFILYFQTGIKQFLVICLSGGIGFFIYKLKHSNTSKQINDLNIHGINTAIIWLNAFILCFLVLWFIDLLCPQNSTFHSIFSFYSTGSMVFGGGHVVLPLLQQAFVNNHMINAHDFEVGYAFAQLMPGPLFSFAAYLGTQLSITTNPILSGLVATLFIFLPSFFLIFASIKYWVNLIQNMMIQSIVFAINAAVVGLLLATIIPMSLKTFNHFADFFCFIILFLSLKFNISIFISFPFVFLFYYFL